MISKHNIINLYSEIYNYIVFFLEHQPPKLPGKASQILFVCKGNVCRSAMAEYISRKIAHNYKLENIKFYSRGLEVSKKNPAEQNAILVCKENGIDLSAHRSTSLSDDDMYTSDIVITMEYKQSRYLRRKYPLLKDKIILLPFFMNKRSIGLNSMSIKDPYGRPIYDFEHCYNYIFSCINNLFYQMKANREGALHNPILQKT
jgi:protein-tyrosine-phosphatase